MIVKVAELLGGDERAIRIAQKLTFAVMWLSEWEWQRLLSTMKRDITTLKALMRRAA